MADPVTSGRNKIEVGEGEDKKTIYTATKITPTTGDDGKTTYKVEIVQYDKASGGKETVIGERDAENPDIVHFNDDYPDELFSDGDATEAIKKQSLQQAESIKGDVATTQEEKAAFNEANGNGNQGTEAENDQDEPTISNINDVKNILNTGAGKGADGTREEGFTSKGKPLVFPSTLRRSREGGQDFLKFDMLKYEPRDFNNENFSFKDRSETTTRTIGTVILPIPGGIQDSVGVGWGESRMTPLDMAKANIALSTVEGGIGEGLNAAKSAAENVTANFGENKKALAAVIAGMAAGAGNLLTRTTGAIANPNMELLFNGPQLRTFSFQFLLAPRNDAEAKDIIRIIRFFKQGMAPIRTKSRLFLRSPHTFQLSYRNSKGDDHKYLNKFKECALGSFGVNYTPNGNYSTYEDGVMTAYQMTMSYRELNPIYNDDYGNKDEFGADPKIGF